jgi:hypothetical protein
MRILDLFLNADRRRSESSELKVWHQRMQPFLGQEAEARKRVCATAVIQAFSQTGENPKSPIGQASYELGQALLAFDKHLYLPTIELNKPVSTAEKWEAVAAIKRGLVFFENQEQLNLLLESLTNLIHSLIASLPHIHFSEGEEKDRLTLTVPFCMRFCQTPQPPQRELSGFLFLKNWQTQACLRS